MKTARLSVKKVLWSFMLAAGLAVLFYGCGINPPVVTGITVTPEGDVVVGATVALSCEASTQSTVGLTYEWSCDGGVLASGGKNASWTAPDTPGTYAITVRVTDNAGNSTTSVVYIRAIASQLAIVSTTVSPSIVSPEGQATISVEATTPTKNAITYTWTNDPAGGRLQSTTGNQVSWIAPTTTGTYTLGLTVTDTKTTITDNVSVKVSALPIITLVTANPATVTSGGSSTLECTATEPGGSTLIFNWDGGGGAVSGSPGNPVTWRPPVSATNGQIFTITVTAVNSSNRALYTTGTANITYTSPGNPIISTTTSLPTSITAGSGAQPAVCTVSNISTPYNAVWTADGGTLSTNTGLSTNWTPPSTVTSQTTCTITLTVTDQATPTITSSATFKVIVNP